MQRGRKTAGSGKLRRSARNKRSKDSNGNNGTGKRCQVDEDHGDDEVICAGKSFRVDDDYGDGEIGAGKRSRFDEGCETGNGAGDHNTNGDDNDDCTGDGEDLIYYYSDDASELEIDDEANAVEPAEKRYIILSQDDIRARQEADTAEVADVLSIEPGFAAVLLRHYKWRAVRVQEEWFSVSGDRHIRDAVGLPADGGVLVPMALSRKRLVCAICFRRFTAGKTRSAACSTHFYCDECWRGYISAAVGDGTRCLSLRCPDTACSAAVVRELVDEVADVEEKARYAKFALWSFVDESGGRIKWCPGRGCSRAVEFVGCSGDATDVFCECTHGFCWSCGEEAHRPVSCDTVRAWLDKNVSESATANWVLTNTKLCPSCRKPIEKSQGCNHMTCRCGHQFCWMCFDPWSYQHSCASYQQSEAAQQHAQRQRHAKASLDRYLYHYERFAGSAKSLERALADMDELKRTAIKEMAAMLQIQVEDLEFLTTAYEVIVYGRRVMRWVYAYGYYLDPYRDAAKRNLLEQLQDDANRQLENLHHSAELERMEFCDAEGRSAMKETYRAYKKQLEKLTKVTRNYFGNLVKAFETDLPEFNLVKNS